MLSILVRWQVRTNQRPELLLYFLTYHWLSGYHPLSTDSNYNGHCHNLAKTSQLKKGTEQMHFCLGTSVHPLYTLRRPTSQGPHFLCLSPAKPHVQLLWNLIHYLSMLLCMTYFILNGIRSRFLSLKWKTGPNLHRWQLFAFHKELLCFLCECEKVRDDKSPLQCFQDEWDKARHTP